MTFKDYEILYMYIAQGQGQITPGDKIFVVTKNVCYFDYFDLSVFTIYGYGGHLD